MIAALRSAGHSLGALLTLRNADVFAPGTFENVHVVDRIPWPKHGYTPQTWNRALADATGCAYDAALIASEEPQAYTFAKRAGIPRRAGFYNGWQKPFKSLWARAQLTNAMYRSASLPLHPEEEPRTLFRLGAGLHAEVEPTREVARLRPLILDEEPQRGEKTLVQLTGKWIANGRTVDLVAAWLRELFAHRPCRAVAAESERGALEPLAQAAGLDVTYFANTRMWVRAIAGAPLVITPDTGAAHVAGMTGTPVVDIFESENFVRYAARWAPWAAPMRLLSYSEGENASVFGTRLLRAAEMLVPVHAHE